MIDAVATSSWPARMAKIVMISSAAFPNVAFRTPPTFGAAALAELLGRDADDPGQRDQRQRPRATKTAVFGADARSSAAGDDAEDRGGGDRRRSNLFRRRDSRRGSLPADAAGYSV